MRSMTALSFCMLLALASSIITLSGLASMQAYCYDNESQIGPELSTVYATTTRSRLASCSNMLRWSWFSWAFSFTSIVLLIALIEASHFKQLKAAIWSMLTCSIIQTAIICNAMVELAKRVEGTLQSRVIATIVGMALYNFFAILSSFAGSTTAYNQGKSTFGSIGVDSRRMRMATFSRGLSSRVDKMFDSSVTIAKISFLTTQGLAWIGAVITLGGVASMQSYCSTNPEYFVETRLPWYSYPSTTENDFRCSSAFADKWWAWALSVVSLLFLALSWQKQSLAKFKAATWALLISSATFNFTWINNLIDWSLDTEGTFHARVVATIAGFIIYDIGVLLSLFTGSVYVYKSYSAGQTSKIVRNGAVDGTAAVAAAAAKAKNVFKVLQIFAWIAQIICLVGLALCQSYINSSSPTAEIAAGTIPIPSSSLRFSWFIWALQLVVIISMVAVWDTDSLRKYKSAVWLLMITAATLNMTVCSHFFRQMEFYQDSYQTRISVAFAGYALWDFFMYLAMFAGSAHAWEQRQASDIDGNNKNEVAAPAVDAEIPENSV